MQRATNTFHVGTDTGHRTIESGDLLEDSDPVVKSCASYFESDEAGVKDAPAKRTATRKAPARKPAHKTAQAEEDTNQ